MKGKMRTLVAVVAAVMPQGIKKRLYRNILGYHIDPSAWIGISIIDCTSVVIGPHSQIGHFNVFRDLTMLTMNAGACVGQWNWFSSATLFHEQGHPEQIGRLEMREKSVVTSRHYFDCSGGVFIGEFSLFAGVKTTVITHQIDYEHARQTTAPVHIGPYSSIGANCSVVPGTVLAARSLVAMGTTLRGKMQPEGYLWAGVPAVKKKPVEGVWFHRTEESVGA